MIGWTIAAALLGFPAITWLCLHQFGVEVDRRPVRLAVGTAIAGFCGLIGVAVSVHGCMAGRPPLTLHGICLGSLTLAIALGKGRPAILLCLVLLVGYFGLLGAWVKTVHSDDYTGNPQYFRRCDPWEEPAFERWQAAVGPAAAADPREYGPGWLSHSAPYRSRPAEARLLDGILERTADVATALPHTLLTGLYGKGPGSIALWYPGGKPVEAMGQIRYRRVE
jgi:hypothetical protein